VGSSFSNWEEIYKELPQGSILDPVLFKTVLNDISGADPRGARPKIGKNMIFWHKIVYPTTMNSVDCIL
jgi:hypothetical protein